MVIFGGAIYAYHSDIKLKGRILIEKNIAKQNGGGIHSVSSSLTLINDDYPGAPVTYLHFVSNSATLGGGMCLEVNSKMYLISIGYTPRCRSLRDFHYRGPQA